MSLGPKHFWLRLYQLHQAFDASGSVDEARRNAILDDLMALPPELREQSLRRLESLGQFSAAIAAACKEQQ
jgi:hypothetical protein